MGRILNSACKSTGIFCGNGESWMGIWRNCSRSFKRTYGRTDIGSRSLPTIVLLSNLLNTKTRTFVNKIKAEDNGKRNQRKKAETWMKLFIDPHEVCQSPYDIFAEMSDKENELNRTKQLYFSPQQIHQPT